MADDFAAPIQAAKTPDEIIEEIRANPDRIGEIIRENQMPWCGTTALESEASPDEINRAPLIALFAELAIFLLRETTTYRLNFRRFIMRV